MSDKKIELISYIISIVVVLIWGYVMLKVTTNSTKIIIFIAIVALVFLNYWIYKKGYFKPIKKEGDSSVFLIDFWIFKMYKRDAIGFVGSIFGLIGLFYYHVPMGTLAIACGIISRYLKSLYWSWVVFGGICDYAIWAIDTFWV